ncbi:MAG: AAA family ATPase [Nostoc sp. ChiSLP02]|nr:AAA family ATPase [Nostoc sp. DedSLP05]MDZ8100410.1 AAA family ATPase [Nostoc sp. DedSLP01]MDZ8187359.1 AAA family ATPase [Nostoc sp. ChiSLP02]
MINIPGYHLGEKLYDGLRTLVYRAVREIDSLPAVIKILKNPYPSFSELVQFRNQYTIAKNFNYPEIIQTYSLEPYQNGYALVMEDFGGISLKDYFANNNNVVPLDEFLQIAIALCNILDILYRDRIIHKDIKPSNILINPDTKQVKLIDFSIASLLPRETQILVNPNVLEGTLAYISPEQTGRMNRGIDYRTDFYSLGVTFYELLTGELPFTSDDAMELLHCHIGKMPPKLEGKRKEVPRVLCEIINKLMAKNAEDRYQSVWGLKFDLENCLYQLKETGRIESFEIASRDACNSFIIPDKLYGRDMEVQTLLQAFERVSLGATEMMLVAGFSGIGKTAVVNEVHKPIVRQRGYFIKGKFDQFQRNIPFSGFVQAFRNLMKQLLTDSDTQIEEWKNKILSALGEHGQVIIEVIPELQIIIGQQPPAPELSGTAVQNRFNLLFQKFTKIFTTAEHPLVIFLDDLQWADSASLKLIQLLMADASHLLLIGAYRDNEVSPGDPLMLTLNEIAKSQAIINRINLAPLSQATVNQLIADTLKCTESLTSAFSVLIYQKTQGNPFFTTQFIKALHQENIIQFDIELGCWKYDITQVKTQAVTDDVVTFMALQLQKLPLPTQQALQLAACIGNQFDLETLAIVSEKSQIENAANLWKALQEGLILPIGDIYKFYQQESLVISHLSLEKNEQMGNDQKQMTVTYKFIHDRVQQAAYSLITDEQKQATHLKIGQLLLNNTPIKEQNEKLFEIVNQFNIGKPLIVELEKQIELAQLNLNAGQKARTATAYTAALEYSTTGIALLKFSQWQTHYNLNLALYELAAETAYLSGNFEQMNKWVDIVLQQAKTPIDKMKAYAVKVQGYMAQGKKLEAVQIGLEALESVGVSLPKSPDPSDIQQALTQTVSNLQSKKIEDLINLPLMTDVEKLAATRMLASMFTPTYQAAPALVPLVTCELMNLSLKYGNSPFSTPGYAFYGMLLNLVFQESESGYEFGQLAIKLAEQFNASEIKSYVFHLVGALLIHCKVHVRETLSILWDGYETGLDSGNFEHGGLSAMLKYKYSYLMGQELSILVGEMASVSDALARLKQENTLGWLQISQQTVLNLLNPSESLCSLRGEVYNEEISLPLMKNASDRTGLNDLYLNKLILCYLFGEYKQAQENALQAEQYLDGVQGIFSVPVFHLYDSLAHLAIYPSLSRSQQEHLLNRVANNQGKMQLWANYAPMNFQHKFDLVAAEQYRIVGNKSEAMDYYDRAIALAKEHGYIQEAAIANELAAKFYLDWGKQRLAEEYMTAAYYSYARWGARAKVADLERRYPQLLGVILEQTHSPLSTNETIFPEGTLTSTSSATSSSSVSVALDLATILKASQTISGEIEFEKLLSSLLAIVIENAGADKCVLMLMESDKLLVRALAKLSLQNNGNTKVDFSSKLLELEPVEESMDVPVGLVNTVKRSLQPVVIIDANVYPQLNCDPYIEQHQPKSILCSPILHQGKLLGVLYLENNLVTGAFTSDRAELLNLLCAQAAISLENARLYERSQKYAQQLERSLDGLSASNSRFEKLVDNVPGVVYQYQIFANGAMSLTYMSRECYELYEITPEEAIANVQLLLERMHPDDAASYQQSVTKSMQTLTPFEWSGRIITLSGIIKWIHAQARIEQKADGTVVWDGLLLDISEAKQVEEQLRASQQRLQLLVQQTPLAVIEWDNNFQVTDWNPAAEQMFGYTKQEALGHHFTFIVPQTIQIQLEEVSADIISQKGGNYNINENVTKDGKTIICAWYNTPLVTADGQIIGVASLADDMTDVYNELRLRKLAEAELQQKAQELETALQNLQQAQLQMIQSEKMSALGNLVAGVAHEMNNPLGFIAASIKQAKPTIADIVEHLKLYQESLPNKSEEILEHAEEIDLEYSLEDLPKILDSMTMACERLRNISTSLRTFSRADLDYKVPFNIHQGIDSTILILKHRLKANEQRPEIEVIAKYGNLPQVECFPGQLNQVFMNILANAIDALDESNNGRNFDEIKVNPNRINITTSVANNFVKITIADNGKGMPESVKEKIFNHLFTTKAVGKGTGLGLAIARQIIEETHHGKLSCHSILGEGTEFLIEIPI